MLDQPCLILNRQWTAVGTAPVRHALVLLCRAAASVICPQSYEVFDLESWLLRSLQRAEALRRERLIRTPRHRIELPEVLLLRSYAGIPRQEVAFSRRNLYRRDGYRCQYCNRRRPPDELSIDHVVPRSKGGPTSWENCVLACVRCNTIKANKPLARSGLSLQRPPRKPNWSPLLETLPQARPQSWHAFLRDVRDAI